jgi:hypothetical protein
MQQSYMTTLRWLRVPGVPRLDGDLEPVAGE